MEPWLILRCPEASAFIYAMPEGEKHKAWVAKTLSSILSASKLQIKTDPLGKPRLPDGMGFANWSHSKGQCVLAYSRERDVGVDLEFYSERNFSAISKRFFHAGETASNADEFFALWARKEAYYKCVGGSFLSVLKSGCFGDAKIWNLQGPYREKHELALAIRAAATPASIPA